MMGGVHELSEWDTVDLRKQNCKSRFRKLEKLKKENRRNVQN